MSDNIYECDVCQQNKTEAKASGVLLELLPIPSRGWTDISMDFIDGLTKSDGYDSILVVVDRFTK